MMIGRCRRWLRLKHDPEAKAGRQYFALELYRRHNLPSLLHAGKTLVLLTIISVELSIAISLSLFDRPPHLFSDVVNVIDITHGPR